MNDDRDIVLVCYDCHKLIGTKENYHTDRRKVERGKKSYYNLVCVCDGCHDKNNPELTRFKNVERN
jgi:hypothetical protein